jgi:hypothetical protein
LAGLVAIGLGSVCVFLGLFGGGVVPGAIGGGTGQAQGVAALHDLPHFTVPSVPVITLPRPLSGGAPLPSHSTTTTTTAPPGKPSAVRPPVDVPSTFPNFHIDFQTASYSVPAGSSGGPTGGSAQVAQSLISAIDRQSGGRYDIPASADNVTLLERWMANEGGLWADNPLNTSLDAASYPHQGKTGIPIYPSIAVGIQETAKTLLGNPVYAPILRALSSGTTSCETFAAAVIRSPWASSHYGYDPARFCGGSVTNLKVGRKRR